MTVRAYTWEDEGAPTLPNVTGQRLIDNLRVILKACLVEGCGLISCLRFGVIGRKAGFNYVIAANVSPEVE